MLKIYSKTRSSIDGGELLCFNIPICKQCLWELCAFTPRMWEIIGGGCRLSNGACSRGRAEPPCSSRLVCGTGLSSEGGRTPAVVRRAVRAACGAGSLRRLSSPTWKPQGLGDFRHALCHGWEFFEIQVAENNQMPFIPVFILPPPPVQ